MDLLPGTTEIYCPSSETVHSTGETCLGQMFHMSVDKAPEWEHLSGTLKYCRRCSYTNVCRCSWCSRCDKATGNNTQGHYWSYCKVSKTFETLHFCCPDNCELGEDKLEDKNS